MGLLESLSLRRLDRLSFCQVVDRLAAVGIGRELPALLDPKASPPMTGAALKGWLKRLTQALDESPVPASEWPALETLLGGDLLTALVDVSPSSLRRYRNEARTTPDEVAERLHWLSAVVSDLAGAYNDLGIRRWFHRTRTALDGRSPAQLLAGPWSPDQEGPGRVRELARSLSAGVAT